MPTTLIGYSGFVGSVLLRQTSFDSLYRSTTIDDVQGKDFDLVVCAAAPAQKWIANQDPAADLRKIEGLISRLKTISCRKFILISTVDVFKAPRAVYEDTDVDEEGLHAYGLHRRYLEKSVQSQFTDHLIVRLPGLVGPGLRKNIIYDFLHHNNIEAIDSRAAFQFYPMTNLWFDIQAAVDAGLKLIHLTAEPTTVSEVAEQGFGMVFDNPKSGAPVLYDMRSRHGSNYGTQSEYQYSKRDTIQAVRAYAQYEEQKGQSEGAM
jgi:nucleoside-diphosphate-sugar epimerase